MAERFAQIDRGEKGSPTGGRMSIRFAEIEKQQREAEKKRKEEERKRLEEQHKAKIQNIENIRKRIKTGNINLPTEQELQMSLKRPQIQPQPQQSQPKMPPTSLLNKIKKAPDVITSLVNKTADWAYNKYQTTKHPVVESIRERSPKPFIEGRFNQFKKIEYTPEQRAMVQAIIESNKENRKKIEAEFEKSKTPEQIAMEAKKKEFVEMLAIGATEPLGGVSQPVLKALLKGKGDDATKALYSFLKGKVANEVLDDAVAKISKVKDVGKAQAILDSYKAVKPLQEGGKTIASKAADIAKAKASGKSFDEWVKGQDYLRKQAENIDNIVKKSDKVSDSFLWGSALEKKTPKDIDVVVKLKTSIKEADDLIFSLRSEQTKWATIKNKDGMQYPTDITIVDKNGDAYLLFGRDLEKSKIRTENIKNLLPERKIGKLEEFYGGETRSRLKAEWDKVGRTPKKAPVKEAKKVETVLSKATTELGQKGMVDRKSLPSNRVSLLSQKKKTVKPEGELLPNNITSKSKNPSSVDVNNYLKARKNIKGNWGTKAREVIQDRMTRVKRLIDSPGMKVVDESDPYLAETLFHGRVSSRIEKAQKQIESLDKDLIKKANILKINDKKLNKIVDKYLIAKHAPERNALLGEKAAGISNTQAEQIVKEIEGSSYAKEIKKLAENFQEVHKQTLDVLKDAGLITDELYTTLKTKYKNHIPLQRVMDDADDVAEILTGKSFSTTSSGLKRAKGSEREISNILENITVNLEQAIVRAEKNRYGQSVLNFARDNKQSLGDLIEVSRPQAIGKTFDGKPIIEKVQGKNILTVFEKGKMYNIKINDDALAAALTGVNRESIPAGFKTIATITRFYSGLATRFNPEFAFSNIIRDTQENLVYLASQKKIGFTGAVSTPTKIASSFNDIKNFMLGKNTPGAKLYRQMVEDGGTTGGMGLSTKKQVKIDMEKMRKLNRSNPRKAAQYFLNAVDNWNQIFEDANRLSSYKVALDKGMSRARAAQIAKESTVNFNRKGTAGSIINSLWMFSNASIQGSTKMLKAMKNPKVAAAVTTAVTIPTMAINRWNDSVDPEWRDKVTDWDRVSNLPVMIPTDGDETNYITIPIGWGIKPIKVFADVAYDISNGASKNIYKEGEKILISILEAYNPIGGTDAFSAVTPTILDLPAEIARNKAWYGAPIHPDWNEGLPESERFFKSLEKTTSGRISKKVSEKTENLTNAEISINPENIDYAFNNLIGGAGKFVSKLVNTVSSIGKDDKPRPQEIPVISRFLKERSKEEVDSSLKYEKQDEFYKQLRKMETGSDKQKGAILDYIREKSDEDIKKELYVLNDKGFPTKGIPGSKNAIVAYDLYNKWKDMNSADRKTSIAEWKKTTKKEEGEKILQNVERYRKNDKAEQKGLGDGWMGKEVAEKAQILADFVKNMSDEERRKFLNEIDKAGLASDSVKQEYNKLRKSK